MQNKSKIAVLIPAYEPDEKLLALAQELQKGDHSCVVVDDGSGDAYAPLFAEVSKYATVLTHPQNMGKGRALKTGIRHCADNGIDAVVTADSDGQHAVADICRIASRLEGTSSELILGVRDLKRMPPRSRTGNTLTRALFKVLYGIEVTDTQTGLRGFAIQGGVTEALLRLPGERYEYEMNMLIRAHQMGWTIAEEPIQTIYYEQNAGSHFRPLRDGLKIYRVIFQNMPSFILASLTSFVVDYTLFSLLMAASGRPLVSTVLARVVSAICNFGLNKKIVFKDSAKSYNIFRYFLLAGLILALNCGMMYVATAVLKTNAYVAKIIVELLLYLVSYTVQNRWAHGPWPVQEGGNGRV